MPLRYYPSYATINNLTTNGAEFFLNGTPYSGKYYQTIDNEFYSGPNPEIGPSEKLATINSYAGTPGLNNVQLSFNSQKELATKTNIISNRIQGQPGSFFPQPIQEDYTKGYITRYFTKKENERGYIIEISREEYNDIVNGDTDYDIRLYQVTTILWKLTGPLNNTRKSQYNIIPGIIETNRRLTEASNKNFLGIVEFIGGDYTKFARPTM
jgi:hypothetical protein